MDAKLPVMRICRFHIRLQNARRLSNKAAREQISSERKGRLKAWQAVIGLEVHAQIQSASKLFSGAATKFAAPINQQVAFLDAALPGTLPVLNRRCVEAGILTAFALNCDINLVSKFDRKHYFYADLPAGYQITQQRQALANNGHVVFNVPAGGALVEKSIRITQLQLEQDSGKSLHDPQEHISLIDLNRAGVGLMEIVTAPDFSSGEEAAAFIRELKLILTCIGTCDCKMSEGSLRVDASVSLHEPGEPLGVRTEVKNINSVRYVAKAIDFEIKRQKVILDGGGEVENETRFYNSVTRETVAMRDKEKLHDYRFMAEPNLPPLRLHTDDTISLANTTCRGINVDELRRSLPPLPAACRRHLMHTYSLPPHAAVLIVEEGLQELFEYLVKEGCSDIPVVCDFLEMAVMRLCREYDVTVHQSPVSFDQIKDVTLMLISKRITPNIAKKVLRELFEHADQDAATVVDQQNWAMIQEEGAILAIIDDILLQNPKALREYKSGKKKVEKYFIGAAKATFQDRVDLDLMLSLLKKRLDSLS